MIPMMTKEEFEKAVEICTSADRNCGQCPLNKKIYKCGGYFARYIKENRACTCCNRYKLGGGIKRYRFNITP